jgi:hypothetical protein
MIKNLLWIAFKKLPKQPFSIPFIKIQTCNKTLKLRVFENRMLRTFGPKRDEVTGGWRKLHNEELHNLYSSRSVIRMIKSRRMRWAGHVVRMGGEKESIGGCVLGSLQDGTDKCARPSARESG